MSLARRQLASAGAEALPAPTGATLVDVPQPCPITGGRRPAPPAARVRRHAQEFTYCAELHVTGGEIASSLAYQACPRWGTRHRRRSGRPARARGAPATARTRASRRETQPRLGAGDRRRTAHRDRRPRSHPGNQGQIGCGGSAMSWDALLCSDAHSSGWLGAGSTKLAAATTPAQAVSTAHRGGSQHRLNGQLGGPAAGRAARRPRSAAR
jgi:hypothetical protein